jgi:hypothetical protein
MVLRLAVVVVVVMVGVGSFEPSDEAGICNQSGDVAPGEGAQCNRHLPCAVTNSEHPPWMQTPLPPCEVQSCDRFHEPFKQPATEQTGGGVFLEAEASCTYM